MDVKQILKEIVADGASDIFIIAGRAITYKKNDNMITYEGTAPERMKPDDTREFVNAMYEVAGRDTENLKESGDDDFSFALPQVSRFRVNAFKQRGSYSAVIRIITFELPQPEELGIPETVMNFADSKNGMILVTGPAGSGKSTTLACIIDRINHAKQDHIITLEDPIEFLHSHDQSIVTQREVKTDTQNYLTALRAALRQSPDVILLGEMRDYETIDTAITAAETGHLIFSTLHTISAAATVERIIDVFPASEQKQIAIQLASVLRAIISQKLIPSVDGTLIPAFEIMTLTPAIQNLIREGKTHQIDGMIFTSQSENMISMDTYILNLVKEGRITKETAIEYANNPRNLEKRLNLL